MALRSGCGLFAGASTNAPPARGTLRSSRPGGRFLLERVVLSRGRRGLPPGRRATATNQWVIGCSMQARASSPRAHSWKGSAPDDFTPLAVRQAAAAVPWRGGLAGVNRSRAGSPRSRKGHDPALQSACPVAPESVLGDPGGAHAIGDRQDLSGYSRSAGGGNRKAGDVFVEGRDQGTTS